jgi:hypothetical protein
MGRAIAQAVSRWLPTAVARVRARVWSCGICGGQSGAGAGFLRVLRFSLPIFIPPIAPQSPSSIIWGLYNKPEVTAVPSGLSPTPLIIKKNSRTSFLARDFKQTLWNILSSCILTFKVQRIYIALLSFLFYFCKDHVISVQDGDMFMIYVDTYFVRFINCLHRLWPQYKGLIDT